MTPLYFSFTVKHFWKNHHPQKNSHNPTHTKQNHKDDKNKWKQKNGKNKTNKKQPSVMELPLWQKDQTDLSGFSK